MKLFDKRFVHVIWDDKLEGKECFLADYIDELQSAVERDDKGLSDSVVHSGDKSAPFKSASGDSFTWRFAYYDPYYSIKKAFNEGKQIQLLIGESYWKDISSYSDLLFICNTNGILRIKPEEEKWIAYLARQKNRLCYLTSCHESFWESIQKDYGAKTKLFVGTENEVEEWYEARQKFAEVIKGWEDGEKIQVTPKGTDKWVDLDFEPSWDLRDDYRVKPECPCDVGIDSKACAGCPQDEVRKQTVRPFKDCDELVEFWSKNYQTGLRPMNTKPLIWVRLKCDGRERLIVAFGDNFVEIGNKTKAVALQHLFEQYEFLDGSPCGMEKE